MLKKLLFVLTLLFISIKAYPNYYYLSTILPSSYVEEKYGSQYAHHIEMFSNVFYANKKDSYEMKYQWQDAWKTRRSIPIWKTFTNPTYIHGPYSTKSSALKALRTEKAEWLNNGSTYKLETFSFNYYDEHKEEEKPKKPYKKPTPSYTPSYTPSTTYKPSSSSSYSSSYSSYSYLGSGIFNTITQGRWNIGVKHEKYNNEYWSYGVMSPIEPISIGVSIQVDHKKSLTKYYIFQLRKNIIDERNLSIYGGLGYGFNPNNTYESIFPISAGITLPFGSIEYNSTRGIVFILHALN